MQINKIKATNIEMTDAIKAYVEEKFLGLAKFTTNYEPAATADIEIGKTSEHHQKGEIYRCEVTMQIPGDLLRVDVTAEDLYAAIDKAKDLLKEQLAEKKDAMLERRHSAGEELDVTEDTTASI